MMKRWEDRVFRSTLVGLAVVGMMGFGLAAPAGAASLEEVVRLALSTNPRITALAKSREAIDQELRQARGQYLPQLDVSTGFGVNRASNLTTKGLSSPSDQKYLSRQEAQLQLVQRLFDGFETDSQVERQKARVTSAANRAAEDSEFLGLDVANVYLEVLRQRGLKELAAANVAHHEKIIQSLRDREKQGGGNIGDVTQAEGRLARARATALQTENDLLDAEALYRRLIGEVAGSVSEPRPPLAHLPPTLDAALAGARVNNPSVRVFESDMLVAQREREATDAAFYPKVNLEGGVTRNQDFDGISGPDRSYQAMVRLRWNLYRGGTDMAARDTAFSRLSAAQAQRDNALLDAEEKMRHAWISLGINKEKIGIYEKAIGFNQDTLDTYRQQFELLIRTLLDVLDAQNELFTSQSQLVVSRINYLSASYRVLAVGGRLLPTLGAVPPEQATRAPASFGEQLFD